MGTRRWSERGLLSAGLGIGMLLFTGFGVALALATDNLGLLGIGPAVGVAVGAAIGRGMVERARLEGRLATPAPAAERQQEVAKRQRFLLGALAVGGLVLCVVVAALVLLQ